MKPQAAREPRRCRSVATAAAIVLAWGACLTMACASGVPALAAGQPRPAPAVQSDGQLTAADGKTKYHAAKSLSNYRDLYRTFRSDTTLQAMHESFPMITTWDDHEF